MNPLAILVIVAVAMVPRTVLALPLASPAPAFPLAAPQIDSIVPNVGTAPGANVVVHGSGFVNPPVVTLIRQVQSGVTSLGGDVTSFTPTRLNVHFFLGFSGQLGLWSLRVRNPDGVSDTLFDAFQIVPSQPRIDSIVPGTGVGPQDWVVIHGANFHHTSVTLARPGASVIGTVLSNESTRMDVGFTFTAANVVGTWDVRVSNADTGADTLFGAYTTVRSTPFIDSIVPNVGVQPAFNVVIHGGGFWGPPSVRLQRPGDSIVGSVSSYTPTRITASFQTGSRLPNLWDLRVANSDSGSSILAFQTLPGPAPRIDSIVPNAAYYNEGFPIIHGSGFLNPPTVRLSRGTLLVTVSATWVSPTRISANFTALNAHPPGPWDVIVIYTGGGADTLVAGFETLPPRLDSVFPPASCDTPTVLRLTGKGFRTPVCFLQRPGFTIAGTVTNWFDTFADVRFDLSGHLNSTWDVVIRNPDLGADTLVAGHQYVAGPALHNVEPMSVSDSGSVWRLTVRGQCMENVLASSFVRAGEAPVQGTKLSVSGDGTSFTATYDFTDRGVGTWDLNVSTGGSEVAVLVGALQILDGPSVTHVSPTTVGPGPTTVTAFGAFTADAELEVYAPGIVLSSTGEVVSPDGTQLTASVDFSGVTVELLGVRVRHPANGTTYAIDNAIRVLPANTVFSRIRPSAAGDSGIVQVSISGGGGFAPGATALLRRAGQPDVIGTDVVPSTTGLAMRADFDLRGREVGAWSVVVTSPAIAETKLDAFTVVDATPTFHGGLDLTWDGCNLPLSGGSVERVFDCADPNAEARLFANFQVPASTEVVALDAVLDLEFAGGVVPDFWHFEPGGCNASGWILRDDPTPTTCTDTPSPWGPTGAEADAMITAYSPGFNGSNRARLLISVVRPATMAVMLDGGVNYYAFHLVWEGALAHCAGCETPAEITWSSALVHRGPALPPAQLIGTGLRSNRVRVNGGLDGAGLTSVVVDRALAAGFERVRVQGRGFADANDVRLVRPGESDAIGTDLDVALDGSWAAATVDLSGLADGPWDVRVQGASSTLSLPGAFLVMPLTPSARVVFPNGGEVLTIGHYVQLKWETTDDDPIASTEIYVSRNGGGVWERIFEVPDNPGSFVWRVSGPQTPGATALFRVRAFDDGEDVMDDVSDAPFTIAPEPTVGVGDPAVSSALDAITPNPARTQAVIRWALASEARVTLVVHDLQGRRVAVLHDGVVAAGRHATPWDLGGASRLAAGLYFVHFETPGRREVRRLVLVP